MTVLFLDTKYTHILHTIIYILAKFKVGMSIRTYVDFLDHGIRHSIQDSGVPKVSHLVLICDFPFIQNRN